MGTRGCPFGHTSRAVHAPARPHPRRRPQNRVRDLTSDNERRQESYMRREAQLQGEIGRLEDQLRVARGERPNHPAFGKATTNIK